MIFFNLVKKYEEKESESMRESESKRHGRKVSKSIPDRKDEKSFSPVEVKPSSSGDVVSLSIEDTK